MKNNEISRVGLNSAADGLSFGSPCLPVEGCLLKDSREAVDAADFDKLIQDFKKMREEASQLFRIETVSATDSNWK